MMRSLLRFNQSNVVFMTISQCAASQAGCYCAPRGAQFFEALERFELGRHELQTPLRLMNDVQAQRALAFYQRSIGKPFRIAPASQKVLRTFDLDAPNRALNWPQPALNWPNFASS